jgi:hypothetical protein
MRVIFLGIDHPQYFSGYHHPVLQVPIYKKKYTCEEIAEEIESELNAFWDYIFGDEENIEPLYNQFISELRSQGKKVFFKADKSMYEYFRALKNDENSESLYFYFSVGNPHYSNGLLFCE